MGDVFVMTIMVTGIIGDRGVIYKLLTLLAVMLYSIVFGTVRYVIFIWLLYRFSVIYMAFFYFIIGPMFDFLYLVMIYAVFVDRMIGVYDSRKERRYGNGRSYYERLYYFCYYPDASVHSQTFLFYNCKVSGRQRSITMIFLQTG